MMNKLKLFEATLRIAIAALIGFAVIACSDPDGFSVSGVTISAGATSVDKGTNNLYEATVAGNNAPQTVIWSIETTGTAAGTSIDNDGWLKVDDSETKTSITIKAVSTANSSRGGTFDVTITGPGQSPTISGITVASSSGSVARGGSVTFTAAVTGTNNPPAEVRWQITTKGTAKRTSIDASGVLTVPTNEGNDTNTITVRAISTFDPSQTGTKTINVTGEYIEIVEDIDPNDLYPNYKNSSFNSNGSYEVVSNLSKPYFQDGYNNGTEYYANTVWGIKGDLLDRVKELDDAYLYIALGNIPAEGVNIGWWYPDSSSWKGGPMLWGNPDAEQNGVAKPSYVYWDHPNKVIQIHLKDLEMWSSDTYSVLPIGGGITELQAQLSCTSHKDGMRALDIRGAAIIVKK